MWDCIAAPCGGIGGSQRWPAPQGPLFERRPALANRSMQQSGFYAFPVQRDGFYIPFASKQIALRFIGMQDQRLAPSTDEIMRIGTQGILWIVSYTLESSRPRSSS